MPTTTPWASCRPSPRIACTPSTSDRCRRTPSNGCSGPRWVKGSPRTTLLSLHEMSGGNPFFAQEIGLALLRRGGDVAAGERPPIPDRLQELIEDRLEGATCADRRSPRGRLGPVGTDARCDRCGDRSFARCDDRLGPAIENGVVEVVGDRLRFTHPLLASAVYQKIPPARRRELHARLATIVRDPEERARHMALSVEGPDVAVAAAVEEAALLASSRGAPQSAAELWEMARRATPRDRGEDLVRRTHQAGVAHYECGDTSLARSVLEQAVDLSMAGPARARVLLDLGHGPRRDRRVAGGLGRVRGRSGRGGGRSRAEGAGRAEPRVRLAVQGRPRGMRNGTLALRCSWPRSCRNHG